MMTFPSVLLAKILIKTGATNSVANVHEIITRQYDRNAYILRVLRAPTSTQVSVRNVAKASDLDGEKQLAAILTIFLALSPAEKDEFREAFAACATLVGQGTQEQVLENTWQPGHVPPYVEP